MSIGLTDRRLILAIAFVAAGCRRDVPVASVSAEPAALRVGYGQCTPIRLEWTIFRQLQGLRGKPVVFVHLYDGKKIVRAFDHDANWQWTAGTRWIDEVEVCQSLFALPIPRGTYALRVGLYDSVEGKRWPLQVNGPEVAPQAYKVADVEVPPAIPLPSLRYRGLWSPIRRNPRHTQVPALRWLHREGTITVRGGAGSRIHFALVLEAAPLLITYGGQTHRLELGRQTWHVPIAGDEEVIHFAPARPIAPRARTVTIEHVAIER
jgi:hypothetical protein